MYTDPNRACLRPDRVIFHGEWHRLWSHAFLHASDIHLYYNMLSFIWKGRDLERRYGPVHFAFILVILTCLSGLVHVGVAWRGLSVLIARVSYGKQYWLLGVLFALKVLAQAGPNQSSIFSLAAWSELFLIQLSVPNASFLGHLSGIIAGLLYVYGSKGILLNIDASQRLEWIPGHRDIIPGLDGHSFEYVPKTLEQSNVLVEPILFGVSEQ
ncbi:LOW QUALITY PROTEIN: uncharacterized protein LOC131888280 [Tigriopus californicus]|uniref:LOW QUALITY PROTEIN: uncharacterized protein LOC131888280 n=1 Tax=Tigriopus californicus TaxID=6832 RepID=UPI0027DA10D1|nr:LOW QUALITY PROTEIN: uncharacterized protein LOC131888280 [Tigriopus californicus]